MNRLFPIALEHLPKPTLIVASNRRVLFANIVAINAFNIIIGKNLALTFHHPDVLNAVDQTLASRTTESGEFSISGPLAQVFELHSIPISYEPGAQFVLLSLQDKTKAARSEEIRAELVTNTSHELRSPLSTIHGFIETLQGPASDDAVSRVRFLGIMGREAERMKRLIDDLLHLPRVEIDEHARPRGKVDIAASIRHVFEVLGSWAISKSMTLHLIDAGQLSLVKGDIDQLNQVFRNLIEKQHFPRLTERFYRIVSARTHHTYNAPVSNGLGLAIVKHIINRHRGRLKVESDVGVGSTFSIFYQTTIANATAT